uniref:Uncharacterized protein n=1 Tax=Graphocephala atropunctata TaxID=36148 RepID=A0A1B6LFD0_9HEMI
MSDIHELDMKICCIKLSLAARVIAMIGLITSVLIITQISSELAEPEGTGGTVGILLGVDIDEFKYTMSGEADEHRKQKVTEIMVAFLLFTLTYAVASAILIWGTIVEQSWCAIPWLICEAFSFATQVSTLAIHAIALRTRKDKVVLLVSILKLGLSPYFWLVVFCAQRTWARQRRESKANELRHSTLKDGSALPLPNKYAQV